MALSTLRNTTTPVDVDKDKNPEDKKISGVLPEILTRVFSHCRVDELKNARLVNHGWCETSRKSWTEYENNILVVNCRELKDITPEEVIGKLLTDEASFGDIRKKLRVIGWVIQPTSPVWILLDRIGPILSYLRLDECQIKDDLFLTQIIDRLPNLETLILNEVTFQRRSPYEEEHYYYDDVGMALPSTHKLKHLEVNGTPRTPGVSLGWFFYLTKYPNLELIRVAFVSGKTLRFSDAYVLFQHLSLVRTLNNPLKLNKLDILYDYRLSDMMIDKLIGLNLSLKSMKISVGEDIFEEPEPPTACCCGYMELKMYRKFLLCDKNNMPNYYGEAGDLISARANPVRLSALNNLLRQQAPSLEVLAIRTRFIFNNFDFTVFTERLTKITFIGSFSTPGFLQYTPNLKYLKWQPDIEVIRQHADEPFMSDILLEHLDHFWYDPPDCVAPIALELIYNWCSNITKLFLTFTPDTFETVCLTFVNLHHLGVLPFSYVGASDVTQFDKETQNYTGGIMHLRELRKFTMPSFMEDFSQFDKKIFVQGFLKLNYFCSMSTHENNVADEVKDPDFQKEHFKFRYPPVELLLNED